MGGLPAIAQFPPLARIKIKYATPELDDPARYLGHLIADHADLLPTSGRIGIAVGSRGIFGIQALVAEAVKQIRNCGCEPVILPAMGSHGGATAEGQTRVLAFYGVTEEKVKAPIIANMNTVDIGPTPMGHKVYFDAQALQLDGIVLLNRVKPHTSFHGRIESGLLKQLVIGLGNHAGAQYLHSFGIFGLSTLLTQMARVILEKAPVLFGLAVIENAKDTTAAIHLLTPPQMEEREAQLVREAENLMPTLPVTDLDVLVVECMGKNYSGLGIDSNITGRRFIRQNKQPDEDLARRIVCLDLSAASHGNALGVGLADVIAKRLYDKINFEVTYANVITSGFIERGFVPIVLPTDRDCITTAIKTCGRHVEAEQARMVQIANTLELEQILLSRPLLSDIPTSIDWELIDELRYRFSPEGELQTLLKTGRVVEPNQSRTES